MKYKSTKSFNKPHRYKKRCRNVDTAGSYHWCLINMAHFSTFSLQEELGAFSAFKYEGPGCFWKKKTQPFNTTEY